MYDKISEKNMNLVDKLIRFAIICKNFLEDIDGGIMNKKLLCIFLFLVFSLLFSSCIPIVVAPPHTEEPQENQINIVSFGTPITKNGITVTVNRIDMLTTSTYLPPMDYVCRIYFSIVNNSNLALKSTGEFRYTLEQSIYEEEFNNYGSTLIGDYSWIYPSQTRLMCFEKYFNKPFKIKRLAWKSYFQDDTEIELGIWEN